MVGKQVGWHHEYAVAVQLYGRLLPVVVAGLVQGSPLELGAEEVTREMVDLAGAMPVVSWGAPSEQVCPQER
jgi:hypothetical protein